MAMRNGRQDVVLMYSYPHRPHPTVCDFSWWITDDLVITLTIFKNHWISGRLRSMPPVTSHVIPKKENHFSHDKQRLSLCHIGFLFHHDPVKFFCVFFFLSAQYTFHLLCICRISTHGHPAQSAFKDGELFGLSSTNVNRSHEFLWNV